MKYKKLLIFFLLSIFPFSCQNDKSPAPNPEDVIWKMFEAANDGDIKKYLSCFTGDRKSELEKAVADMKVERFANYLRARSGKIMGVAISDKRQLNDEEMSLKVELVYKDKNEVQSYFLKKESGGWKIKDMDDATRIKTLIPYGTKVFEEETADKTTHSSNSNSTYK